MPEHENLSSYEARLQEALAACIAVAEQGQPVDRKALIQQYPELAGEIKEFLDGRESLERLARPLQVMVPPEAAPQGKGGEAPTLTASGNRLPV